MNTTYNIRGKTLQFPSNWSTEQIAVFINTDIRLCPQCFELDVQVNHFESCDISLSAAYREARAYYWKP